MITYSYDATGAKLKMTAISGTETVNTDYSGSFVYKDGALSFFSSPEGRVVKNGSAFEYQYAIADHQGNIRALFTSAAIASDNVVADMEASSNANFEGYNKRVHWDLMDHTDVGNTGTEYSQKLNAGQVGVATSIKVYPGDKVRIEAYAKYYDLSTTGSNLTGLCHGATFSFCSQPARWWRVGYPGRCAQQLGRAGRQWQWENKRNLSQGIRQPARL